MQPEVGPVPQSFLSWVLAALGFKYAILLAVSALVSFVLTVIVVVRGKGAMAGVALLLTIPIPMLIGVFAAIEGGVSSFPVIATLGKESAPGQVAAFLISTLLVAPMVGMALMAPSYILAILVSFFRSLSADRGVSSAGREA
jgi:hypothetical protein